MVDDWTTREAEKDLRKMQEAERAKEKSERDERLKDEGGLKLFRQLHAWMEGQAKSYNRQIPKQSFEVGRMKLFGGVDSHDFFEVSNTNRQPMKIPYRSRPQWNLTVEYGSSVPNPKCSVSVGDDGNLFFETKGQKKTIEELGSELLDAWKKRGEGLFSEKSVTGIVRLAPTRPEWGAWGWPGQ